MKRIVALTYITVVAILLISCTPKENFEYGNNSNILSDVRSNADSRENADDIVRMNIFGKKTISISRDRLSDDIYGTGQLDNRWNLNEIDDILEAVKGTWEIGSYVGFVDSSIYYPDLFDYNGGLDKDTENELFTNYEKKVGEAKNNIPKIRLSIKEYDGENTNDIYVHVNDNYLSPISIIFSPDRTSENYPVFVDRTTISTDFTVEYPTIYIKFFVRYDESNQTSRYEPATLVLSADEKFYILIDGAFYSLEK